MKFSITHIRNWYARNERRVSSVSLFGGFVFNALTLKRVDFFWENFWVVIHLLVVALCIILINRNENNPQAEKDPGRFHFWLITIVQFFFGGLLSTYIVFYFRSTTFSVTWPFLFLLAIAFLANESLRKHSTRLTFQISLFFLSVLSFAIFIVPVFFHKIGDGVFIVSGIASLVILMFFLYGLRSFARERFKKNKRWLAFSIVTIFTLVNVLYFSNLIPPIPLSLKDGAIYHEVVKDGNGNYLVRDEVRGWLDYFKIHQSIHVLPGDVLYAYSAIFSPALFNTDIIHEWQLYDESSQSWITTNQVILSALGGREGGFRTYSKKSGITPGKWRVNVETRKGQVIGRLQFNVSVVGEEPVLTQKIQE